MRDNSFLYISYVSNNQIYKLMITQTKDQYISPMCEELDINLEGVIAMSPKWEPPFTNGEDWTNEG